MSLTIGHIPVVLEQLQKYEELEQKPLRTYWVYASLYRPLSNNDVKLAHELKGGAVVLATPEIKTHYQLQNSILVAVPNALPVKVCENYDLGLLSMPDPCYMSFEELWQDSQEHDSDVVIGLACKGGHCPLANLHQELKPIAGGHYTFSGSEMIIRRRREEIICSLPPFLRFIIHEVDRLGSEKPVTYQQWKVILIDTKYIFDFVIPGKVDEITFFPAN